MINKTTLSNLLWYIILFLHYILICVCVIPTTYIYTIYPDFVYTIIIQIYSYGPQIYPSNLTLDTFIPTIKQ